MKQLKYYELIMLDDLLPSIELRGKETRHRARFLKQVEQLILEFDEERLLTLKEYARTDSEGNLINDEEGNATFESEEKLKSFLLELEDMKREFRDLHIEKETQDIIKQLILDGEFAITGKEYSIIYDELCTRIENTQGE